MNPLTEWACQDVASIISARVAPLARCSRSRMAEVLLPSRTPLAFGFAAFGALVALAGVAFFGLALAAALGLAPLAAFWLLGAPFFGLAVFFKAAFSGATAAPCAPTVASLVVFSAFSVLILVRSPFAVITASGHPSLGATIKQVDSLAWAMERRFGLEVHR